MSGYSPIPFLEDEIRNVLMRLEVQNYKGIIQFPSNYGLYNAILRGRDDDSPYKYLRRILQNDEYGEKIYQDKISENLLIFIEIRKNTNAVYFCNIQAFITENIELADIFCADEEGLNENQKVFYYRLDYDICNLGPIFKESLPHIHIMPKGDPRINVKDINNDFVVDFLDFIYRNHFYDVWLRWVERIVPNDIGFSSLQQSYMQNNYSGLVGAQMVEIIKEVKNIIVANKEIHYKWRIHEQNLLLNY